MLDVKSTNKGILIPRLTTSKRIYIQEPATGLLVFDTDSASFFFYNGADWINLSHGNASGVWQSTGNNLYTPTGYSVGINKTDPLSALEVKAKSSSTTDPLFLVINDNNDTVFAVYPNAVQISIDDKAKGNIGGFAVSGRSATKETVTPFMDLTADNYFIGHESGINNSTGLYNSFFGYQSGKGNTEGGRNVFMGKETGLKNKEGTDNVFLGYQAGYNNIGHTTDYGAHNVFIGTKAGFNNRGNSFQDWANHNVFIGTEAGYNNISGGNNVFIGTYAGFSNQGATYSTENGMYNVFIGTGAGYENETGYSNVYLGETAAYNNITGISNVCIGKESSTFAESGDENTIIGKGAGYFMDGGNQNVFLGADAGHGDNSTSFPGTGNIFVGYGAGYYETGDYKFVVQHSGFPPLISGDLSTGEFHVSGDLTVNNSTNAYLLATDRGANGQVLTTDGTGGTSWSTPNGSSAANGLNIEGITTELGGILNETTKISQGNYSMVFDLTGTGNFDVQKNGSTAFLVASDGRIGIGTATPDFALQVDGDIVPEFSGSSDLGTSTLNWGQVYAAKYNTIPPVYFKEEEIIDILINQKLIPSANNQVAGSAFPPKLKNNDFFSVGETASFNLQANQYQQEIINKQQQEIEMLKKQVRELKTLIESK